MGNIKKYSLFQRVNLERNINSMVKKYLDEHKIQFNMFKKNWKNLDEMIDPEMMRSSFAMHNHQNGMVFSKDSLCKDYDEILHDIKDETLTLASKGSKDELSLAFDKMIEKQLKKFEEICDDAIKDIMNTRNKTDRGLNRKR